MREYVGCPRSPYQVAFVPGDPPRLVAAANTAAYVWPPGGPDPVVLAWDETAWGEPVLTVSADGRWLVAGPHQRLRGWDLTRGRRGPKELFRECVLTAQLSAADGRLNLAHKFCWKDETALIVERLPMAARARPKSQDLELDPHLEGRVRTVNPSSSRSEVALSADGGRLALSPNEKVVYLWDIPRGKLVGPVPLHGKPCGLALSPTGARLAIDAGTTVYVHDTATLELVTKWKANYSYVPSLAWSPDGRLVARTDRSTTVRVYEAATGREVMAVGAKRGILVSAAFAPDGLTLATGTFAGPVRVWNVE
jgi:WD40 repeat protein